MILSMAPTSDVIAMDFKLSKGKFILALSLFSRRHTPMTKPTSDPTIVLTRE